MAKRRGLGATYVKSAYGDIHTTETELVIDNEERLHRQRKAIEKNLATHLCRGNFSVQKAKKGFSHVTTEANRLYKREYGSALPISDRREAERDMVAHFVKGVRYLRKTGKDAYGFDAATVAVLQRCKAKKP